MAKGTFNKLKHLQLHLQIYKYLETRGTPVPSLDISEEFGLSNPSVNGTMKKMEKKGYIIIFYMKSLKRNYYKINPDGFIPKPLTEDEQSILKNGGYQDSSEDHMPMKLFHSIFNSTKKLLKGKL